MGFFEFFLLAAALFFSGFCLATENYVVNNFAPKRCRESPRHNEYVIGVDGHRDVLRYKVVDGNMTRSFGEACCPTNTDEFEMAVKSDRVWTYYVFNWNSRVSRPAHKKVKWSFIENILEKETWKRHKKLELEDKKRREKLELEKKIRSFIRKPMESYRKVKNSIYRYIDHHGFVDVGGDNVYWKVHDFMRKYIVPAPFDNDGYYKKTTLNGGWYDWFQMNKCSGDGEKDEKVHFIRLCMNPLPINNGTLCNGGDGYAEKFNADCKDLDDVMNTKFKDANITDFNAPNPGY